jgi:surface polysaccharide O-acyltransferase-like enzyme
MKLINNIDRQTRDSGIELLKIFAIFVIVINHTVQSLTNEAYNIPNNGFVIDISRATTNIQCILLQIFRHFGVLGNSVFFICSAWFLLKSKNWNKKKWLFMVIEIWVVSIVIFIITYIILHGNISIGIIISSLFPTTFGNNWYMTCYLLFYPIHPILNSIVNMMNQRQLFRSTLVMVFLYVFMNFINCSWFFSSAIILWITIYFAIAYMQKYLMSFVDNIRENIILFIIGVIGFIGIILITDICGLYSQVLSDKVMRWVNNCNPFLLAMSIAMFNIARNIHFKNRFINYISKLSLLIYIIHENIILRTYFRPAMWNYVYKRFGYSDVIQWVFIISFIIFIFGILCSILYVLTLQRFVNKVSGKLYEVVRIKYLLFEKFCLMIGEKKDNR